MNAVGIIAEYNPFHNGHIYHINKTKGLFKDCPIILILNGYFLERGEISLLTKEEKTKLALTYGVDIVVELPFIYGSQSADTFADAAICLLNELKITDIVFGSETDDIELLKKAALIQINDKDYQEKVKKFIAKGLNYPSALAKALDIKNTIFNPNDLLGISYLKAIYNHDFNIQAHTIKRTNDYKDTTSNESIISATNIRKKIQDNEKITKYAPKEVIKNIQSVDDTKLFELLKYRILTEDNLSKYLTVDEGIENRLIEGIKKTNSITELVEFIKTKRYTYNKINRMLIHLLIGLTKEDNYSKELDYLKVLGFTKNGKDYLNKYRESFKKLLKINYDSIAYKYEIRAALIYDMLTDNNVINFEKRNKPIITD